MIRTFVFSLALLGLAVPAAAQEPEEISPAVAQLRHVQGEWDVTTTFYLPDGTPGRAFEGSYRFDWVMEDAILSGVSTIPAFAQTSGLLFYIREATGEIEMTSVGPDGRLWVMTGPIGAEVRETPAVDMPDGSTLKLRFTRFNVTPDRFESRMERSIDGGATWVQGNHQVFVRRTPGAEVQP